MGGQVVARRLESASCERFWRRKRLFAPGASAHALLRQPRGDPRLPRLPEPSTETRGAAEQQSAAKAAANAPRRGLHWLGIGLGSLLRRSWDSKHKFIRTIRLFENEVSAHANLKSISCLRSFAAGRVVSFRPRRHAAWPHVNSSRADRADRWIRTESRTASNSKQQPRQGSEPKASTSQ